MRIDYCQNELVGNKIKELLLLVQEQKNIIETCKDKAYLEFGEISHAQVLQRTEEKMENTIEKLNRLYSAIDRIDEISKETEALVKLKTESDINDKSAFVDISYIDEKLGVLWRIK